MVIALNPLSSTSLLASLGTLGVFLVMFAETGLLIGFFLPGDSLLFTAGLLCTGTVSHAAHLSLPLVILAAAGGALLGAQTGFYIGRAGGRPLLQRSQNPYLRTGAHGPGGCWTGTATGKAIVLARFIPVVRTVLNPLAGALDVPTRTFTIWQVVGGLVWSAGVTLAGYTLGSAIPGIDTYLLPAIAVIVRALADPDRHGDLPHPVRDPPRCRGRAAGRPGRREQRGTGPGHRAAQPVVRRPSWPGDHRPGAAAGHLRVSRGELPASPAGIPR